MLGVHSGGISVLSFSFKLVYLERDEIFHKSIMLDITDVVDSKPPVKSRFRQKEGSAATIN